MNDYLYYNVTNRYYWHSLDTYHIRYLSIASYYWFPITFYFFHIVLIVYDSCENLLCKRISGTA